jgi:hypothetical protein
MASKLNIIRAHSLRRDLEAIGTFLDRGGTQEVPVSRREAVRVRRDRLCEVPEV